MPTIRLSCGPETDSIDGPIGRRLYTNLWRREPKPRLYDAMVDAFRVRHYSRRTEQAYVAWVRRFILFHEPRHPRDLAAGYGEVALPYALSRKYPNASREWRWQFVFSQENR
jgi:hypothetical protein